MWLYVGLRRRVTAIDAVVVTSIFGGACQAPTQRGRRDYAKRRLNEGAGEVGIRSPFIVLADQWDRMGYSGRAARTRLQSSSMTACLCHSYK